MKIIEQIKIENILPGMILGYDVKDIKGSKLMTEHTKLTENDITKLKRRGIMSVHIVRRIKLSPEQQLAHENDIRNRISKRFRQHNNVPDMEKLRKLLIEYRTGQCSDE